MMYIVVEVAKMSPSEIEAALTGHEFLREILGMLKQDIEVNVILLGIGDLIYWKPGRCTQNFIIWFNLALVASPLASGV